MEDQYHAFHFCWPGGLLANTKITTFALVNHATPSPALFIVNNIFRMLSSVTHPLLCCKHMFWVCNDIVD
jgi:hypothetical protein